MDTHSTYPYQKNLEQIGNEIPAGSWRIASFIDLVSEKKFLRFRTQPNTIPPVTEDVLEFRGRSAVAISPAKCLHILHKARNNGDIEILTSHTQLLASVPRRSIPVKKTVKSLLQELGRFEKFNFYAPNISSHSLGIGENGDIHILPNAYILPFSMKETSESEILAVPFPDGPSTPKRYGMDPSVHLRSLAQLLRWLASHAESPSQAATSGGDGWPAGLTAAAAGIEDGAIASLSHLYRALFEEIPPFPLNPMQELHLRTSLKPEAKAIVNRIVDTAGGDFSVIVLKGDAFCGKSSILHMAAEKIVQSDGQKWKVIQPDEWNTEKLRKKSSAKGKSPQKCLWMVDDMADGALISSYYLRLFKEETICTDSILLLAVDPHHMPEEAGTLLDDIKRTAGERYCEIILPGSLYEPDAGDAGSASPLQYPYSFGEQIFSDGRKPKERLRDYLKGMIRYLSPSGEESGATSLDRLTTDMMSCLLAEERQLLEFISVTRFAIPFDIALSIFPNPNGQIHRCAHRLSALGLVDITYRATDSKMDHAILLHPRSASIQRLVYESIPIERRKNLHRTVALHAEERSVFPDFFLIHHLLEGEENILALKHCLTHLKDNTPEARDPLILDYCQRLIHQEHIVTLPLHDQLFALKEMGLELVGKERPSKALELFLHAKDLLDRAEYEDRRKNAEIASSIYRLLADLWESKGEYKKSLDLLTAAREELQTSLSLPEQARLMNDIGWLQYRLGNYESSMESCKLSLSTINPNQHPLVVAQALNIMGVAHFNTSRYDEAIRYYERSAFLRERAGDAIALSGSYNNLALAYQTKGEYGKSLDYYKKSLDIKKRENNRIGIAAAYLNLALLYLEMHDFDEAEKRCRKSLDISMELGTAMLTAEIYSTLGEIAHGRGRFDEGETYFQDSLKISREMDAINVQMGTHRRLATLYLTQELYDQSREHVEIASKLAEQIGSHYESAQIDMILGDLEVAQNKIMDALKHYERAASAFMTLGKNRLAASALARIGLLHAGSMNTFEAMQYLDRAESQVRSDFDHVLPEEIITLRRQLEDSPARTYVAGRQSQNLLMSFYELSLLFDSAYDRHECIKRILDLSRNIIGPDECRFILKQEDGQFMVLEENGGEKPVKDSNLISLLNRTLLIGSVLDSTAPDVSDLTPQIEVGGGGYACIPLKAMGKDLGCLLFYISTGSLPLSKDSLNYYTALGRHLAGILMLMFHLEEHVHKEEQLEKEVEALKAQVEDHYRFKNLIGKSEEMKKIFRTVEKVLDMDTGILIIGESGTGKTELARAIHYNSPRSNKVFQDIHCAQIPFSLIESELFGHEKGSFTGATRQKLGLCEKADGGTIFLDDINAISYETQTKLLNFLETKSFFRVGGTKRHYSDVRIVAASNEDLEELCRQGKFREDLYFRLKVIQIKLPPLRDRKEDIPIIAMDFLKKRCNEAGKTLKTLAPDTIRLFQKDRWPGNVRELQHVLERVVLLSDEDVIYPHSLPEDFLERVTGASGHPLKDIEALIQRIIEIGNYSKENPLIPQIDALLAQKMAEFADTKGKAAGLLGITKPTLYSRLKDYDKMK
jgi:DNA-binding NtrC family response regulator/tetratricopeptide (TPR) repeat protein